METAVDVLTGITMIIAYITFAASAVCVLYARERSTKLFAVVAVMSSLGTALSVMYYQADADAPAVLMWLVPATAATVLTALIRAIVFVASPSHYVSLVSLFATVTLSVTALTTVAAALQCRTSAAVYALCGGFVAWALIKAAQSMQWRELQQP